ncbi:MAG: YbhB/YbcL family Raf kinase inhibitor-like protein [Halorhabdus sp.]
MTQFRLTSSAFEDGAPIPNEYGYAERNINPPLGISGIPDGTETLAIVMDDPDAREPAGTVWDHWVVWNVPGDVTSIPEGYDATSASEGQNDFGDIGYGGPNPPDGRHTYRFVAYALDTFVELQPGATKSDLEAAIDGHVLADATLTGTYAP